MEQVNLDAVNKILEDWGSEVVAEFIAILNSKGAKNLQKSIDKELQQTLDKVQLNIKMDDYGYFVDQGRAAGRMPPREPIDKWLEERNLPLRMSYPLRLKIAREGTKDKAYDFIRRFYEKFPEIKASIASEVTLEFKNYFERLYK